jgi:hypothetical protein
LRAAFAKAVSQLRDSLSSLATKQLRRRKSNGSAPGARLRGARRL